MAKRFSGPHSPDADPAGEELLAPRRHRLANRPKWMPILASPLLLGAFFQPPGEMLAALSGFGLVASGAWMTAQGLEAEAAYALRRVARRPALPRKLIGAALTGLGLGAGALAGDAGLGAAAVAVAGMGLHVLSFGPDPMRDKGIESGDHIQMNRVARAIEETETYLAEIDSQIARLSEAGLRARVARFTRAVRQLVVRVEQNPAALPAARRYLGVYLMGARDATVRFVDLYAHRPDPDARSNYESLLDELETAFQSSAQSLIDGTRSDFDIEIDVLRERLAQERAARPNTALEDRRGLDLTTLIRETVKAGRRPARPDE